MTRCLENWATAPLTGLNPGACTSQEAQRAAMGRRTEMPSTTTGHRGAAPAPRGQWVMQRPGPLKGLSPALPREDTESVSWLERSLIEERPPMLQSFGVHRPCTGCEVLDTTIQHPKPIGESPLCPFLGRLGGGLRGRAASTSGPGWVDAARARSEVTKRAGHSGQAVGGRPQSSADTEVHPTPRPSRGAAAQG